MKKILIIASVLLVLISIPMTFILVRQRQIIKKMAAPATSLSFSPSTVTKAPNQVFALEIKIDTGENTVSAVKLYINFDQAIFQDVSLSAGSILPVVLVPATVNNGKASITLGSQPTTPFKGQGTLAVLNLKTIKITSVASEIKFDPTTQAAGIGETGNIIFSLETALVSVTDSLATPTPTPTPGPSATPTPTPRPTATPTPTPTPGGGTPTPTPRPTATPTPTPGGGSATPTPTPTPTLRPTATPTPISDGGTNSPPVSGSLLPTGLLFITGILLVVFSLSPLGL